MVVLCVLTAMAASDAPEAESRPLAIPVEEHAGAPSSRPEATPRAPLAVPGPDLSPEHASARREFARRHLSVRQFSELSLGTAYVPSYGGWGWGWGWGWGGWAVPTATRIDGWAVYEGDHRLDVPTALERLGDPQGADALWRAVRRKRVAGDVWYGVGAAGLVAGVVGLVGLDQARTWEQATTWSSVATGGFLGGTAALIVGSFPAARSRRLATDPALSLDRLEAESRADDANEVLRQELGLSPAEAMRIEDARRRRGQE